MRRKYYRQRDKYKQHVEVTERNQSLLAHSASTDEKYSQFIATEEHETILSLERMQYHNSLLQFCTNNLLAMLLRRNSEGIQTT